MKTKWLLIFLFIVGFLFVALDDPLHAQNPPKTFTLIYSNNINGEIEPCPT
jgi:hypothetical protein